MSTLYWYCFLSGLFNAVVNTYLGVYILSKNIKSIVKIAFSLLCFCIAAWSYPYSLWPLTKTAYGLYLVFGLLHIGACYVSIFAFHFVIIWLDIFKRKKYLLYFGYLVATFFAFTTFSSSFTNNYAPKFSMTYWADAGILYHFYLVMFFGFFLYASYLLFRHYFKETGIKKMQIKFILIGVTLSFIGGSTNYFMFYDINIPPYGNILASTLVICTAYAITRYRFMDMRMTIGKGFFTLLIAAFAYGTFYLVALLEKKLFGSIFHPASLALSVLIAVAFVFLFNYWQKLIKKLQKKKTVFPSIPVIVSSFKRGKRELNKFFNDYTKSLKKTYKISDISFFLREKKEGYVFYYPEKSPESFLLKKVLLDPEDPQIQYFKLTKDVIILDEIPYIQRQDKSYLSPKAWKRVTHFMKKYGFTLAAPIFFEEDVIGIMYFSQRKDGKAYTKNAIEELKKSVEEASNYIWSQLMYIWAVLRSEMFAKGRMDEVVSYEIEDNKKDEPRPNSKQQ